MLASQLKRFAVSLFCLLLIISCARLPDYARPRVVQSADPERIESPGFSYRTLTREDFQAPHLPADYRHYQGSINAQACIRIRPKKSTQLKIIPESLFGQTVYVGHFTQIGYEALFIPSCSWWNPTIPKSKKAYVLQHEQVHFAISELVAQNASKEIWTEVKDYTSFGASAEEVASDLSGKMFEFTTKITKRNLMINTEFDNDTSMIFNPKAQQAWYGKIQKQLEMNSIKENEFDVGDTL
jgi:hypothetical protein